MQKQKGYFGARRVRGKRGRGAGGKILVLGLLKREGFVFTEIVNRATRKVLLPIVRRVVQSGSDIYTDSWGSYHSQYMGITTRRCSSTQRMNLHVQTVPTLMELRVIGVVAGDPYTKQVVSNKMG